MQIGLRKVSRALLGAAVALASVSLAAPSFADNVPFNSGWTTDRQDPAVFSSSPDGSSLTLGLAKSDFHSDPASAFYNTQGKAHSLPGTGSPQFVTVDFNTTLPAGQTEVGTWTVGVDSTNTVSAYSILAFHQADAADDGIGATGFYDFDYNVGTWNLLTTSFNSGWNTLSTELDPGVGYKYFLNGVQIGTFADTDTVANSSVILNAKNFGVADQSFEFRNLSTDASAAPLPNTVVTGLALFTGLGLCVGVKKMKKSSLENAMV